MLIAGLVASGWLGYAAYLSRDTVRSAGRDRRARHPGDLGDPGRSQRHTLAVQQGQLEIARRAAGSSSTWRASTRRSRCTAEPGQRGWKVLFLRRGMAPFTVDASMVDPTSSCGCCGSSARGRRQAWSTPLSRRRSRSSSGACRCGCPRRPRRCARWCAPRRGCPRRRSAAPGRCRARRSGVRRGARAREAWPSRAPRRPHRVADVTTLLQQPRVERVAQRQEARRPPRAAPSVIQ